MSQDTIRCKQCGRNTVPAPMNKGFFGESSYLVCPLCGSKDYKLTKEQVSQATKDQWSGCFLAIIIASVIAFFVYAC